MSSSTGRGKTNPRDEHCTSEIMILLCTYHPEVKNTTESS